MAVSVTFNFMENLDVRFNKLVSDLLALASIRFDIEAVSIPFNFVENLDVRFNTDVSVLLAYNA